MAGTFTVNRTHLIYGLCLPLALLLGYLLAEPLDSGSLAVIVLVLSVLLTPLLMKWYHPALIFCWNSAFYLPLVRGGPPAWMGVAALGMVFMLLSVCVDPTRRWMRGGLIPWSLVTLAAVVFITAALTGGIGLQTFGSSTFGGKKYLFILASVAAYFVMTGRTIPKSRALLYAILFFLSGATAVLPQLAANFGHTFDFLHYLVSPSSMAGLEPIALSVGMDRRIEWVNISTAVCLALIAKFGVGGLLDFGKPWRLALFVFFAVAGLLGGFRSFIANLFVVVTIVFILEGLHRTKYLLLVSLCGILCFCGLALFATKFPLSVQRSLSFLPVNVHPAAASSAAGSLEWRIDMWREVMQDVPRYFFKGRGCVIDPTELFFSSQNLNEGFDLQSEWAIVAGDYHNGPLSILIPFGIWGTLAFGWFMFLSVRLLYRYTKSGDPVLQTINRLIFACLVTRLVFFVFLVGAISSDLPYFVALVGLAISLNWEETPHVTNETETNLSNRAAFLDI
jgi:hypothetical protein